MLKQILDKFSKKQHQELSIIRPGNSKTHVFELDYATQFCENSIINAARELKLSTHKTEYSDQISEQAVSKLVLFIANPRLLINSRVLEAMIAVLDSGADACGPCFSASESQRQQGQVYFPLINFSTYEEHNAHTLGGDIKTEKTNELDKSCILCTREFYLKHRDKFHTSDKKTTLKNDTNSRFAILKNSHAFVFSATYGTPRKDLIDLIPEQAIEILELGCAEGTTGKLLQENYPKKNVDAVEMSTKLAELAKPFYRKTYISSFEKFAPKQSYDAIICGDVIEHMADPWEQIGRMHKMLKPGGSLIASLPNAGHWSLVKDMLKGKFEYLPVGITCITHLRWFTEASIKKALEGSGFGIEVFYREQLKPSPEGKKFIHKMVEMGYGDEQSLLTNEFTIRALKK